jgi:hypothetical protein
MSNFNRLVVFGCSNTAGEGLPVSSTIEGQDISELGWPNKLATMMGIDEVVNFGIGGAGNKRILHRVFEKETDGSINPDTDVVVILWSYFCRHCIFHDDGSVERFLPSAIKHFKPVKRKNHMKKEARAYKWYADYHSFEDQIFENYTRLSHAHHYLNNKDIRYHGFTCEDKINSPLPTWFDDTALRFIDIHEISNRLGYADDDSHPSELGHSDIAEIMYNHITRKAA